MMIRSLWSGATGMKAMQFHIDAIAHDLTNVNTNGYKKKIVNFQDLLYQTSRASGLQGGSGGVVNLPVGVQVGLGVRVAGTTPVMTMGSVVETGNWSDMLIEEPQANMVRNFFQIDLGNGNLGYTRDGNFRVDDQGRLTTVDGYFLDPQPGSIDPSAVTVQITPEGRIMQRLPGNTDFDEVGQVQLFTFINPAGLEPVGNNRWVVSESSGAAQQGAPGDDGFGLIRGGFIEQSNVDAISEMVNMIAAQRAYEFNSKSITTSDEMLQTVNNLKR
ncbi:MAG: flagellar basal-body rod protein FlgG [Planctomycetota bacterium]|jgi:flagellar basal-body rod protein FlgG|nr:flagellar basal-body rod protein FlgG [Planctomycetota bacterium]